MKRWHIGFVVPRYGEAILGGAETLARGLAEQASVAGFADVQVLTTCGTDYFNWQNELPAGETIINGVPVLRFPIDQSRRDVARYATLEKRLLQRELIPPDAQYEWVHQGVHSPSMYHYIESRGAEFDFLLFVTYLRSIIYYGTAIYPERSVLWPCFHDEIFAYLWPTRDMYRNCVGVLFNTYPESCLARRLYGRHPGAQIVGFGFSPWQTDHARFHEQSGIHAPFILYSGRLEGAKNLPLLMNYFLEYKKRKGGALKLVLMGQGPERIPEHPDIINVGFKIGQEKSDIYAAAILLCQPSVNESFSIVMMESWLCGTPVVVHADCEVTRYNVTQSNGGLYFREFDEFEAVLDLMLNDEPLRQHLGRNGNAYVRRNYNWQVVLDRFESALSHWAALRT